MPALRRAPGARSLSAVFDGPYGDALVAVRILSLLRGAGACLGGVIVLGAGFESVNWASYRILRYRLEPLYAIAREVEKGMSRDQVLRIIDRHDAPYLEKHFFPNGDVTLSVQYALRDTCWTSIGFKAGALDGTWTIGEDNPADYCPNAPRDVR